MTPNSTIPVIAEYEAAPVNAISQRNSETNEFFLFDDIFHFRSFDKKTNSHKQFHEGLLLAVSKLVNSSYLAATCTSTVNALTSKAGKVNAEQLRMNLRFALPTENVSFNALPFRLAEYINIEELPKSLFDLEIKFNLVVALSRAIIDDHQSYVTLCRQVASNWQELCNHLSQAIRLIQQYADILNLDLPDYNPLISVLKRCEHRYSPYLSDDLALLLPGDADRRRCTRYSCGATMPMEFDGKTLNVIVSNISSTGMRLLECSCLTVGDHVHLKLGRVASVQGEVVWTANGAAGIKFNLPIENASQIAAELAGTE